MLTGNRVFMKQVNRIDTRQGSRVLHDLLLTSLNISCQLIRLLLKVAMWEDFCVSRK